MPLYRKQIINQSPTPSVSIPSVIKTTAKNDDYFIGIDENEELYRIKKSDLFAGLSSGGTGGGTTPPSSGIALTYVSDGDANGLFYHLGTNGKTSGWINPHTSGIIQGSLSSAFSSAHNRPEFIFDRQVNDSIATANIPNSWYMVDLKTVKLKPNYYSIRARDFSANNPSNWIFQASNDNTTWIDLDMQQNKNLQINQWFSTPVSNNNSFRYFRFLQNGVSTSGDHIFCVGEIEIYGTLS